MKNIGNKIENAVNACGMLLYGVDHTDSGITVYIEKNDHDVNISDCEAVMKQLSYSADIDDLHIEVSSKGLYPRLFTLQHYSDASGQWVKVRTHKQSFKGILLAVTDDTIQLKKGENLFSIPLNTVRKAQVIPEQIGE